jgi:hypothetical protein
MFLVTHLMGLITHDLRPGVHSHGRWALEPTLAASNNTAGPSHCLTWCMLATILDRASPNKGTFSNIYAGGFT